MNPFLLGMSDKQSAGKKSKKIDIVDINTSNNYDACV